MELCVTRPEVITSVDAEGNTLEPMEHLVIDVPEAVSYTHLTLPTIYSV